MTFPWLPSLQQAKVSLSASGSEPWAGMNLGESLWQQNHSGNHPSIYPAGKDTH